MNRLTKQEFYKICGIFCLGVIIYGVIISFFTSTVYVNVDEELYVALAKSFHYAGRFEVGGAVANYNCVLYSMLLSLAYFFYSPEHILFSMRFMGVLSMCSAIFPIWLLARKILDNKKEVLFLSCLSMLMPYMFDCVYLIQEVLSYPLFLWTVYFLYLAYERINDRKCYLWLIIGAVFSVLDFFTKTYLFFIPIVFNISLLLDAWRKKSVKAALFRLFLYDGIYLILTGGFYIFLYAANGFAQGNNHYASQFSWLFPITERTVISGITCLVVYIALLIINLGILPILSVWLNYRKYEKVTGWFARFILTAFAFLLVEIVVLIVLTEEGAPAVPHKFLFRYFQVLVPCVLILFMKVRGETAFLRKRIFKLLSIFSISVAVIYFIYVSGNTRQAIADGYFYLFLENAAKIILPYADAAAVLMIGGLEVFILRFAAEKTKDIARFYSRILYAGIIALWLLNCIQLPVYTNLVAGGKSTQEDSLKLAEFLNENEYEFIYYVVSSREESNDYVRNFYGYMKQPHQVISLADVEAALENSDKEKAVFLVSTKSTEKELKMCQVKKVELGLNKFMVYIVA